MVKDQILAAEKDANVENITTMNNLTAASIAGHGSNRLLATISVLFGALSLLLAGVGIYGIVSFTVALRTREIGIRTTLGAPTQVIIRLVLHQGIRPVLWGLALGFTGAFALTRLLKGFLFGVAPDDPPHLQVLQSSFWLWPASRA